MSENSKPQNNIEILAGEYEGTLMRINLPPELEKIVLDMQKELYDYDFLQKGLLPESTSYYRNPGKKWINKKFVTVYLMLLVRHWLRRAVNQQRLINSELREKITSQ